MHICLSLVKPTKNYQPSIYKPGINWKLCQQKSFLVSLPCKLLAAKLYTDVLFFVSFFDKSSSSIIIIRSSLWSVLSFKSTHHKIHLVKTGESRKGCTESIQTFLRGAARKESLSTQIFPENPEDVSLFFIFFFIKIVKMMRVSLGLTMNIFLFFIGTSLSSLE